MDKVAEQYCSLCQKYNIPVDVAGRVYLQKSAAPAAELGELVANLVREHPKLTIGSLLGTGGVGGWTLNNMMSDEDLLRNKIRKLQLMGPAGKLSAMGGIGGMLLGLGLGPSLANDMSPTGARLMGAGIGTLLGSTGGAALGNILGSV